MLGVSQCYEYASNKTKQNPGVLSFISQKITTEISANLFLNLILPSNYYLAVRNYHKFTTRVFHFRLIYPCS